MYKEKKDIYIKAISPIHAGTGQSLTSVDMPIQREQHSNIPKIEGSSLKGSIKHTIYHKLNITEPKIKTEFYSILGPENGEDSASGVSITDAKLLLFPMRSATDIYQLITCPYILKRWHENTNQKSDLDEKLLNVESGQCIVGKGTKLLNEKLVMLEEYIFDVEGNIETNIFGNIPEIETLKNKIVILSDSDFVNMISMYTEIITRNKINVETGTAKGTGGLFTEEYLPAETVLYFSIMESAFYERQNPKSPVNYVLDNLGDIFQVGGNETIGKGFVKILKTT